ncbi:MAG: SDR family oxidoreductase [Pirellulales bacterium]|nr:SDR family oxidoreductase [Pirellulales bacterium]
MRKVLVTGGAGFVGSHIVDALLARGDQVRVLDNLSTGQLENIGHVRDKIDFIEADLTDAQTVARAVNGVDCIFHQAALASVPRSMERPLDTHAACVTGTLVLLEAARKARVRRLVYAASSSAYGDQPKPAKSESDLPLPISPYGAAKLAAEYYCRAFAAMGAVETVSLRYFNVFGPRQNPSGEYSAVIPKFITLLLKGKPPVIYGDGSQSRDFTFVANVVEANLLAAEAPEVSGKVFNVAMGDQVGLAQLVELLNKLLGTKVKPKHEAQRPGDIKDSRADISQARKWLKYDPQVCFEEGLRRSIDYYRSAAGK